MIRFEMDDLHILNWPSLSYHYIINSFSQFNTILSIATNITFENGVGNDEEITSLNFARFIFLQQINIMDNSLNNVKKIITNHLKYLKTINIGENCLNSIEQ